MKLTDFSYDLPEDLVAQQPLAERDRSRLLVVERGGPGTDECIFAAVPSLLEPGDLLVVNDSRVFPARMRARRKTGRSIEVLLLGPGPGGPWRALVRPSKTVRPGEELLLRDGTTFVVGEREADGISRTVTFPEGTDPFDVAERFGETPLPPYIRRGVAGEDAGRYQTVFARLKGSAAAPTAGLHFTEETLVQIRARGITTAAVTLHVGAGTFLPVRTPVVEDHPMHEEFCTVGPELFEAVAQTRKAGGRVIAVGTTVVRALETAARRGVAENGYSGWTDLFIYPPFTFRWIDAMVTNFHLPESTLLMLVCAFAGTECMLRAYREAVTRRFRFYSYGDAMFIRPAGSSKA